MSIEPKPLSLYQAFECFKDQMNEQNQLPKEIISRIEKCYIAQFPIYDECKTKLNNDLFPRQLYRQLKWMKDKGWGEYKVGGSTALKLASADNTWDNEDVDIMVYTEMDPDEYAALLGLTHCIKRWTRGVDEMNGDREEKFHESIYKVLTFQHNDFDKKIQCVFFEKFNNPSFTNFLDQILDYPAHVLYEVDFDKNDMMTYNFFLPINMWGKILQKRIPINLHCPQSRERIEKYRKRGFKFFLYV